MCTIDQISGGRAIAGLGAGWQENEHASYGIELGTVGERIDRFSEYVEIVTSMLDNESTTFEGAYFSVHDAPCDPRPIQESLPVLLGVRGRRRTMAIAAEHATVWNSWCTPETLADCNGVLDAHCEAIGRDPATLERSTQALLSLSTDEAWLATRREAAGGPPAIVGNPGEVVEIVARYEASGCDELIIPTFNFGSLEQCIETIELFNTEVIAAIAG